MSEQIKLKIAKLLNLARDKGASENEAATAMAMATKLMLMHGIAETDMHQSKTFADKSTTFEVDRDWMEVLVQASGKLFGCMTLKTKNREGATVFYFIGRPDNHDAAIATYQFLSDQVERLYKTSLPRGLTQKARAEYRRTFKYACAVRVYHRAEDLIAEMSSKDNVAATGTTALVVQGHFEKLADEVDEFLKHTGMKIRVTRARPRSGGSGTMAGRMAGDSVNLRGTIR